MNSSGQIALRRPDVRVLADLIPGERLRDVALVAGAACVVGISAQITIPVPGSPVPISGQTFAALLAGAALGWQRAALAMMFYMLAGGIGMPWFSDGQSGFGLATMGYIVGFSVAAVAVGALDQRQQVGRASCRERVLVTV